MAIRTVVTRGYGNSTFNGTIALVVPRGYKAGAVVPPTAGSLDFAASNRKAQYTAKARKAHFEAIDQ